MALAKQQRLVRFLCACLIFIPLLALADGKVFTRAVAVPVTTPDQRALLYYSNGVERLVIETSFVGEGTNFAWVVPFPSAPKIEAVSENFFPSLNAAFQPKLIYKKSEAPLILLIFGAVTSVSIFAWRRKGMDGIFNWFCLMAIVGLFASMAIPNFVVARGGINVVLPIAVTILDQKRVGVFDTVTLSGTGGRELLEWLNANQFYTPTNALPILARYAAQRWVFVAATINREDGTRARSQLHPLAFTFQSEKPVYPLQLTGVENSDCTIELFVFGPSRAEAEHFRAEYCGKPFALEPTEINDDWFVQRPLFAPAKPGEYRIANEEVHSFAMPAAVTTKLVGTLSPRHMESDAWIRWVPFNPTFPVLYSREGARSLALTWFTGVAVLGALLIQLGAPLLSRRAAIVELFAVLIIAAIFSGMRFATLRTIEIQIIHGGYHVAMNNFRQLGGAIDYFSTQRSAKGTLTFEEFSTSLTNYLKSGPNNCFTGKPLRNEASPGNITLHTVTNGTEVIWHDINANPHPLATFPNSG